MEAKKGIEGDLIVNLIIKTQKNKKGKQREVFGGVLPTISFKVVDGIDSNSAIYQVNWLITNSTSELCQPHVDTESFIAQVVDRKQ